MTVIEFGKKDIRVNALYITLGVLVVCAVFFSIVSYSNLAALRQDTDGLKKNIAQEQVKNAELKTEVMAQTEQINGEEYLASHGYVLDKDPVYEKNQITQNINPQ